MYACDTFDELTLTHTSAPSCSNTQITQRTISTYSNTRIQWDITTLLQTNLQSNNDSISFTLSTSPTASSFVDFYSSENADALRPKLRLVYVENIGGLTPPSQPVLNNPTNGEIIYDTTGDVVASPQNIQLV